MVYYNCLICDFTTPYKTRFTQHNLTKKHQKNCHNGLIAKSLCNAETTLSTEQYQNNQYLLKNDEQKMSNLCKFCNKNFSRKYNLQRHESVCKLTTSQQKLASHKTLSKCSQNAPVSNSELYDHQCSYCLSLFKYQRNLNRHIAKCKKKMQKDEIDKDQEILKLKMIIKDNEKDKEIEKLRLIQELDKEKYEALLNEKDKTINLVKNSNVSVTNINNNNKTINFLNNNYGDMIAMEKFLYNLEHNEQLNKQERESLLLAYKENGVEVFSRCFSYIMKQNCIRQLEKEGKPPMSILPLFCSDGSLRSHKEKGKDGWMTHYDNKSINQMLNISNDQVYQSHNEMICITGKERNRVYNTVKRDNHVEKIKFLKMIKK